MSDEQVQNQTEVQNTSEQKEDFIDVLYPSRKKYKGLGPVDCNWPDEQPVTVIQISRPTNHDGEAIQVSVPIFKSDTEEDLLARFNVIAKIGDLRMRENNDAMMKAQEIDQQAKQHKALAEAAHKAELKAVRKGKKTEA